MLAIVGKMLSVTQGSVATHSKCDVIFNDEVVTDLKQCFFVA